MVSKIVHSAHQAPPADAQVRRHRIRTNDELKYCKLGIISKLIEAQKKKLFRLGGGG
jgi:hypothetical protein